MALGFNLLLSAVCVDPGIPRVVLRSDWRARLRAWRGTHGRRYVRSAGARRGVMKGPFSVLRLLSPDTQSRDVFQQDRDGMLRLHSGDHGLNI